MFFINICYTVITYRIKDRMEAVPVIILERRPVIRNGGIEVGMDRTKILVVDDESRMRKLVKDFLQKNNYDVWRQETEARRWIFFLNKMTLH